MAKVIPKLKIDTGALHTARRKLQSLSRTGAIRFAAEEREALLGLISAGKRLIYPTQMGLDRYRYLLDQIEKVDPISEPNQFNHFAEKINEFEKKYCQ